jgi:hypothetical protein
LFKELLDWKLLEGSHEFPGADGGTCVNEAAIVAAGFEYKMVQVCRDCPPCFSRPIAAYAIGLNDRIPSNLRQELLMPFVTRLANTADTPRKEALRMELIAFRTIRDILPISLRTTRDDLARQCEQATDFTAARYALYRWNIRSQGAAADAAFAAAEAVHYCGTAKLDDADYAQYVGNNAAEAALAAVDATTVARLVFTIGVSILDEAIRFGRHSKPIEAELANNRMQKMMPHAFAQ